DHLVSEFVETPHGVSGVAVPAVLRPDLDAGAVADHGNRRARIDPGQPSLLPAQADPTLGVELAGHRLREQRPGQRPLLWPQERILKPAGQRLPLLWRIDGQHSVLADRDETALRQLASELGRYG